MRQAIHKWPCEAVYGTSIGFYDHVFIFTSQSRSLVLGEVMRDLTLLNEMFVYPQIVVLV